MQFQAMDQRNCPKCGSDVGQQLASTRMTNCPSCGTSLFLRDDRFELAGDQGVMHDAPSLISLGDRLSISGRSVQIIGQARFSYGRGWWDEFWAIDGTSYAVWISVDEGDVVVQTPLLPQDAPLLPTRPALGVVINWKSNRFVVSELETARCEALRGTLPEIMTVGETFDFANCSDDRGRLLSGEFWPGGQSWSLGEWVDPFDVRQAVRQ